jgi:hypothetical protein
MTLPITDKSVREMAGKWYVALDEHVDLDEVIRFLDEGFELHIPDGVYRGVDGFARWYDAVINRFFDEVHTIAEVCPEIRGDRATVTIKVNWQAKIWDPPAARSTWLGFDAEQTWEVVAGRNGPVVRKYVVNSLRPMPGSASL